VAKAAARRLKVFQAQLGFYDTVVAAPSQAAALRAWGVHQNLFADGLARLSEDPQTIEAALSHPETPLKRAVGSSDPFSLEGTLPKVPEAPPSRRPAPNPKPKPEPRPAKPPPDRSALDAAEAVLQELEDRRKQEEAEFRKRLDELKAEQLAAQEAYVRAHKGAAEAVAKEQRAYRGAGGRG
jgi:hypothetical protein